MDSGRPTKKTAHFIVGLDLIEEVAKEVELNMKRMKKAQDRQKSYTNLKRRSLEFQERWTSFLENITY